MEMLCPSCMGELSPQGNRTVCALCGKSYEVLFARGGVPSPAAPAMPSMTQASPAGPAAQAPLPAAAAPEKFTVKCPSCGTPLDVARQHIGKKGRCKCGYVFVIEAPSERAAPPQSAALPMCANHPNVEARYACSQCHRLICETCAFRQSDGSRLCPSCASSPGIGMSVAPSRYAAYEAMMAPGTKCVNHPNNQAVRLCGKCGKAICSVCDFTLAGNLHFCPACATASPTEFSSKRRKRAWWSVGLAIWCSVVTVIVLLTATLSGDGDVATGAFVAGWLLAGVPSIIGFGVGLSGFEKRLHNPTILWVGVIWNGLIMSAYLLLVLIGNFIAVGG